MEEKAAIVQVESPSPAYYARARILTLNPYLIQHVLSFLSTQDVYCTFALTSKKSYKILKIIETHLQKDRAVSTFGTTLSDDLLHRVRDFDLMFKQAFAGKKSLTEIPYYGFKSDGGVDAGRLVYWIDKVFTKGHNSVCSQEGKDFHYMGCLIDKKTKEEETDAKTFEIAKSIVQHLFNRPEYQERDMCHAIITHFFQIDGTVPNPQLHGIQMVLMQKVAAQNNMTEQQVIDSMIQFQRRQNKLDLVFQTTDLLSRYLRAECEQTSRQTAVIRRCEISRKGTFTCPVRTLALFGAHCEFEFGNSHYLREFSDALDARALANIIEGRRFRVGKTNIPELLGMPALHADAREVRLDSIDPEQCAVCVFANTSEMDGAGAYPIAWVQFVHTKCQDVAWDNFVHPFLASHVVLKLIDCENKVSPDDPRGQETNIDISYVSLQGDVVQIA